MRLLFLILMVGFLAACGQQVGVDPDVLIPPPDSLEVASLQLNEESILVLSVNESKNLMVEATLSDGSVTSGVTKTFEGPTADLQGTVKWFSNNSDIVTVSEKGEIVAVAPGTTTVKATLFTQSVVLDVVVQQPVVTLMGLSFHQSSFGIASRVPVWLTLDAQFSDGTVLADQSPADLHDLLGCNLSLSSFQSSVAVINQEGKVNPVSKGVTLLEAKCGNLVSTIRLTVFKIINLETAESGEEELLESMTITSDSSEGEVGNTRTLTVDLHFNTGDVGSVSDTFVTPSGTVGSLEWSSDSASIMIDHGVATFASYGAAVIIASYDGLSAEQTIDVKMADEEPIDYDDHFLRSDDVIPDPTYGVNGGYADYLFPEIVYGMPRTGGTHVVSFGGGGFLSIQLNNYVIVDGLGPDFTLFENPINSDYYGYFAERAQISVSDNGVDYTSFPCDVNDPEQIYVGCAGVNPVDASVNPLDPSVSGGDQFDLADVGLSRAKYILIQDLNTCTSSDPTYYTADGSILCATSGQQGFDLDALAILNGVNE